MLWTLCVGIGLVVNGWYVTCIITILVAVSYDS